ncbi:hypothetical protein [Streptomyces sp. N2A]|uniref:hypothetical protein n=1 Tax=Streptomyces sp. N2A TaxID=3073936 RepID=UPI002870A722|nr:hypothetical protein [Streptomyces sp. N2A]
MTMHIDLAGIVLLGRPPAAYAAHQWKEVIAPVTIGANVVMLLVLLAIREGRSRPRPWLRHAQLRARIVTGQP